MAAVLHSDAVAGFAAEYVSLVELTGPHSGARLAAFWCLSLLRDGEIEDSRARALGLLAESLGRPASGSDVVSVLGCGRAVPADVAEALHAAYGAG